MLFKPKPHVTMEQEARDILLFEIGEEIIIEFKNKTIEEKRTGMDIVRTIYGKKRKYEQQEGGRSSKRPTTSRFVL